MRIGGLQKLTLLDFPQKVACTIFLQGCNYRCPFCHNTPLLEGTQELSVSSVLDFLKKRQGMLDGVAITGGEPLLNQDIVSLLEPIKALGYAVKLDTNGSFPERLRMLIDQGLIDYVAMDIKNCPEKYDLTCGSKNTLKAVEQSVRLLLDGTIPYEFRTTVVDELHEEEDFHKIGTWLRGAKAYYLQSFVDSGNVLSEGLHAASKEKLANILAIAGQYIQNTSIRGL
ncbi:MAG: anaerobic ribonucleoside-triphosphate reductase activating protein [Ruminococcaceae bacterium]|nr:anaerobic ribonucleoside-triphosphate reductase activating protein [Oscillospiraceae bacterium]